MNEQVQDSVSNPDQQSETPAVPEAEKAVFGSSEESFLTLWRIK